MLAKLDFLVWTGRGRKLRAKYTAATGGFWLKREVGRKSESVVFPRKQIADQTKMGIAIKELRRLGLVTKVIE